MYRTTSSLTLTIGMVGMLVLAGCAFKGGAGSAEAGRTAGVWEPTALAVRVHQSTRFVAASNERATLHARVELVDAMGDSLKAAGQFRLELFASDEMGRTVGRRLYQWQIDISTLEAQREHYDSVTRAYLFRLRLDDPRPPSQPTLLRATFMPADRGERLEGQAVLGRS